MSGSSENTVRYTLDVTNPPPLTPEQEQRLAALASRPDSEIDYSDIPPVEDFSDFYRPNQEVAAIRLDKDVIAWLRTQGLAYHATINRMLRREMQASLGLAQG